MAFELPVTEDVALSVAVIIWLPPVASVAEKDFGPGYQRRVGGKLRMGIGAGEMHRAGIVCHRVIRGIECGHCELEGCRGWNVGRTADGEMSGCCRRRGSAASSASIEQAQESEE